MEHQDTVRSLAAVFADVPGGLMPALHAVQNALGHIPPDTVPLIAEQFNLSRAEVHGVVSYYHHFRSAPPGRLLVQVCRAEACKSMGADALLEHAKKRLGCDVHCSSADGQYSLEPAFCLGLCASSPSIAVNDEVHARITPALFDEIIDEGRSAA